MVTHGGRLPAETTRFFGRTEEAAAIRGALGRSRLVTLTGPGGVGKTRIAVRVAREQSAAFADGVCMVQLSGLRDPELLPDTVADALGLPGQSGESSLTTLVGYLRGKRMLIILDTCEHLIDACAMLADVLLRGADGPRLLATSRQALDIPGEVVYPIGPLAVPEDGGDAVALFADRVAAAVPGFAVTGENRTKIVNLCRGLDGIPLAIELAAVRLRAVGLDELLDRLGDRLRLLASGSRRVTPRHQTLRMTIGWSYELCSDAERLLWTRLSVFAGEFGLSAAETVCSGGPLGTDDIIDTMIGLVDKSIVLRADDAETADGARYLMLDAIREYGAERLVDGGRYRARHLEHYLGLARAFSSGFLGPEQVTWIERIARDHDNIRVALEYSVSDRETASASASASAELAGRVLAGLDLATEFWGFWMATGRLREGSRWLQRLLDKAPEPTPHRARGLWLASWFLAARGHAAEAGRLRVQAREIAARSGTRPVLPQSMAPATAVLRALRMVWQGAFEQTVASCDTLLRELPPGEKWVRSSALWVKGLALWFAGDLKGFVSCQREGIKFKSEFGDLTSVAHHLEGFAWLAARQAGSPGRPGSGSGVSAGSGAGSGSGFGAGSGSGVSADSEAGSGSGVVPDGVEAFVRTARLQGAADHMWRQSVDEPRYGLDALHAERARAERLARETLGPKRYAAEYAAGTEMGIEEAVRYALGEAGQPPAASRAAATGSGTGSGTAGSGAGSGTGELGAAAPQPWGLLTAREREVATLVAEGMTNKDVAARLVVSKRTVDAHVEHILGKLGYSSRLQIAALASQRARTAETAETTGPETPGPETPGPETSGPEAGAPQRLGSDVPPQRSARRFTARRAERD